MDIYIDYLGSSLKKEKEHFLISSKDKEKQLLAPELIESFIISDGCSVTTNSIEMAVEKNIPIYFANKYGEIYGKLWKISDNTVAELHLKQLKVFNSRYGNLIGRKWTIEKINCQKDHLIKLYERKKIDFSELKNKFDKIIKNIQKIDLENTNYSNIIMGYEGMAGNLYYSSINSLLAPEWQFNKRNNYKAKEPYNIILNYLFGILYSKTEHALTMAGLNLNIGIFHSSSIKQKSLLFDFIEPYRIIAWETVFSLFSRKIINKNFFDKKTNLLTYQSKKAILPEFYKRLNNMKTAKNKNSKIEYILLKKTRELAKDLMENEIYNQL